MKQIVFLLLLSLCFHPLAEKKPTKPKPPRVKIKAPVGGQTSQRSLWIEGSISDPKISRATIVINGTANEFDVKDSNFRYFVVLAPGENILQIIAENSAGVGSDNVTLYAAVPKRDLKVVMTWDTATDIDLHATDPAGEECYYKNRNTKAGGQLDNDDTDGFGPETFLLSNAPGGKYVVKVKYYGGQKGQTLVNIQVVKFEGTSREQRNSYQRILTKSGEFAEVCSFFVEQEK